VKVRGDEVIEYKSQAQEKNKFLAGIVSLVNTEGGDLILGVKEEDGIPVDFCGLEITNADEEINRLEKIIRNGVEPKITGHEFHAINLSNGQPILILRLPSSWAKPHV